MPDIQAYLRNNGQHCLFCQSDDLDCGELQFGWDNEPFQEVCCGSCGNRWVDHYDAQGRIVARIDVPPPSYSSYLGTSASGASSTHPEYYGYFFDVTRNLVEEMTRYYRNHPRPHPPQGPDNQLAPGDEPL